MAWITSPLLAIYNVAPITLFLNAGVLRDDLMPFRQLDHPIKVLIPIFFITSNTLIVWYFNIWLIRQANQHHWVTGLRYAVAILFTLSFMLIVTTLSAQVRTVPEHLQQFRYYPFIGMASNTIFILIMIDLIMSQGKRAALEIEKAGLLAANLRSRHEQLKQQVQPHFLFNALYTLKLLIKNDEPAAESYTVRLSRFLRASIVQGLEDQLTVKQELEIFKDYMEMQKVRFPDGITYVHNLSPQTTNSGYLPAFTFQTLAENALKHNAFDSEHPLTIRISEVAEGIRFVNNVIPGVRQPNSTGIGLANLSERFRIISGRDITVEENNHQFIVTFKVSDHESSHH